MPEWLRLKNLTASVNPPPVQGVILDVVVSPYDVPEAVRGFKTAAGRFRIEFRYIDGPEPASSPQILNNHVVAFEGRHSKRLLALEVDIDAMGAQAVGLSISTSPDQVTQWLRERIDSALNAVVERHTKPVEKQMVETTKAALKTRESDLLNQMAGV